MCVNMINKENRLKNIIIVDIDGTISKIGDRLKYLFDTPKDWDSFYRHAFQDEPIQEIIDLVFALSLRGYKIVFCTGRKEIIRDRTEKWISKYFPFNFEYELLLMRENKDHRSDTQAKIELVSNAGILLQEIAFVLEDRNSMVKKWRSLGVKCLQCAEGDF